MTDIQWLTVVVILTLFAFIGVPLLEGFVRIRDFKAQIDGKKPQRTLDENSAAPLPRQPKGSPEFEGVKWIAELKSKQNFFGPK
ncbi:MAG: hypothetical protein J5449_04000 [Oscillospiraceae bacterium]|nr:hypothetical protein [Oscillospiraceae bacterium]